MGMRKQEMNVKVSGEEKGREGEERGWEEMRGEKRKKKKEEREKKKQTESEFSGPKKVGKGP